MKGRFYFWMLMGMISLFISSEVSSQEKSRLLLSVAREGDHHMSDKKSGGGFEHVHALAMDAEGRTLFAVL